MYTIMMRKNLSKRKFLKITLSLHYNDSYKISTVENELTTPPPPQTHFVGQSGGGGFSFFENQHFRT